MYQDMLGKQRVKLGLHVHTSLSDGRKSPEEVAELYQKNGYDAIAFTDHWYHGEEQELKGLKILSGAEYNIGGTDSVFGVYHIVCLMPEADPKVPIGSSAQEAIDCIHRAGGLAVLAHPAWSLNTPEMIFALRGIDATEIFNTVSGVAESFRADSSLIVDMVFGRGKYLPLLATDDAHYYEGNDACISYVMVESGSTDAGELKKAILEKRFYATQGPEIHLSRNPDGNFVVQCSPVNHIYFVSACTWSEHSFHGDRLTYAEYTPVNDDKYIRAMVIDQDGKYAWSNSIVC